MMEDTRTLIEQKQRLIAEHDRVATTLREVEAKLATYRNALAHGLLGAEARNEATKELRATVSRELSASASAMAKELSAAMGILVSHKDAKPTECSTVTALKAEAARAGKTPRLRTHDFYYATTHAGERGARPTAGTTDRTALAGWDRVANETALGELPDALTHDDLSKADLLMAILHARGPSFDPKEAAGWVYPEAEPSKAYKRVYALIQYLMQSKKAVRIGDKIQPMTTAPTKPVVLPNGAVLRFTPEVSTP